MEDPCIAADGNSYERREIESWFARGKRTSPMTGAQLPHTHLTPNINLRKAIQNFLEVLGPGTPVRWYNERPFDFGADGVPSRLRQAAATGHLQQRQLGFHPPMKSISGPSP